MKALWEGNAKCFQICRGQSWKYVSQAEIHPLALADLSPVLTSLFLIAVSFAMPLFTLIFMAAHYPRQLAIFSLADLWNVEPTYSAAGALCLFVPAAVRILGTNALTNGFY